LGGEAEVEWLGGGEEGVGEVGGVVRGREEGDLWGEMYIVMLTRYMGTRSIPRRQMLSAKDDILPMILNAVAILPALSWQYHGQYDDGEYNGEYDQ